MTECMKCNSHDITCLSESEKSIYKNTEYDVLVEYSVCDNCQREFISKDQILANDARVREEKKKIDGLLTASELKDARAKLGLNQTEAASIFGGGVNAFSKYERSEVTQSVSMDRLIRMAVLNTEYFIDLIEISGNGEVLSRVIQNYRQEKMQTSILRTVWSEFDVQRSGSVLDAFSLQVLGNTLPEHDLSVPDDYHHSTYSVLGDDFNFSTKTKKCGTIVPTLVAS